MILLDSDDASIQNGNKNFLFMNNRLTDVKTIKTPKLSIIDVKKLDKGLFEIEIKSDVIALFVWLDISENKFFGLCTYYFLKHFIIFNFSFKIER